MQKNDETIREQIESRTPIIDVLIKANIVSGIKVDKDAKTMESFHSEKVTES